MIISHACVSDRGLTHAHNEDRWFADPRWGLYLVADGMADARPSQLVIERLPDMLRRRFGSTPDPAAPATAAGLQATLDSLNDHVRALRTTGTTLVLVLVRDRVALIAHLGDSRIYLFRADQLEPLTRDHSLNQERVDQGELSAEEAARLRFNGGPTRFLGMWGEPEADVRVLELVNGDRLLLCSDGLPTMLADSAIAAVLARHPSPDDACHHLIDAANGAGGLDNVTALILAAEEPAPSS